MAKWMLKQAPIKSSELAQALSIEPIIARILAVRGYHDPESARQFLHAGEQELASVWLFADMEKAVKIAATAINEHMRVAVFGDYDVDGVMSTVILTKTFTSLSGDVVFYIPERESEGYGLNNEAILKLKNRGVDCIFACDNGVSAMEQVEYANSLGMKIVILDHHALLLEEDEQGKTHQLFPAAAAIVDAKRDDCSYPFENYCAAGICYRFSQAIYEYLGKNWQSLSRELLPLAAIATVCDIVELVGENRFLVQRGLPQIPQSSNLGIQALLRATGISDKVIGTYQIGFILGPCINASGRLEMAEKAVELFLADNPEVAAQQATYLAELNTCRRTLTEQGTAIALAIIEKLQLTTDKVIVIYSPEIAESVAGIIAGRIKEKFCRPTVVLAGSKEVIRGSCRSVEGYNIFMALNGCSDILEAFGGHPLAAGLSILPINIERLRQRLNAACQLTEDDMQPLYRIDKLLPIAEATLKLAKSLTIFEPYGKGNSQIYFADQNLQLFKILLLGKDEQIIRWYFRQQDAVVGEAISFSGKEKLMKLLEEAYGTDCWQGLLKGKAQPCPIMDILYTVNVNVYNNRESAQLQITDFRLTHHQGR